MKTFRAALWCMLLSGLFHCTDLEAEGNTATCTQQSLHAYRTVTFNELMRSKNYVEAAQGLEAMLEKEQCWDALVEPIAPSSGNVDLEKSSPLLKGAEEYLWAESDRALAYLKADKPGECLTIVKVELQQYHFNPLEIVSSEKLRTAFETNEKLCTDRRSALFPKLSAETCEIPLAGQKNLKKSSEDSVTKSVDIKSLKASFKLPPGSDFSCIAVVNIGELTGIVRGFCDNIEDCRKNGSAEDLEESELTKLVGVSRVGNEVELSFLEYFSEDGWCGEPEISLHREALKEKDSSRFLVRVATGVSPCGGGTGRGEVDSYFAIEGGKLVPRDESNPVYH